MVVNGQEVHMFIYRLEIIIINFHTEIKRYTGGMMPYNFQQFLLDYFNMFHQRFSTFVYILLSEIGNRYRKKLQG